MHELPDLSGLSVAEKDALILALFEQVKQVERLTATVQALSARVRELEGRLRKDSHNSSKPPSSDGLSRKPKSLRQASGRKPGGQKGHDGSTLERVGVPDVVVQHPLPEVCDQCGATLAVDQAVLADERRQVFDLPRMGYEVTAALSWYGVHDRRGQTVMDDFGILPRFAGVAVHDGWAPYRTTPVRTRCATLIICANWYFWPRPPGKPGHNR